MMNETCGLPFIVHVLIYNQFFSNKQLNKAGYTANTSRGRVGRGGNACFSTFHHGPTNRPTDRQNLLQSRQSTTKKKKNKAGYTANTSRGRLGRGRNARFRTLSTRSPRTNQPTDQPTNRRTDGRTKPLIESLVRD